MRRAIIHIGTKKTGTTSIQGFLARQRRHLPAQGACYPTSPGPIMHVKLYSLLMQRRRERRQLPDPESPADAFRPDEFAHAFDAEMQALPPSIDRVILSEERLSLIKSTEDIAALQSGVLHGEPLFGTIASVQFRRPRQCGRDARTSVAPRLPRADRTMGVRLR
jgi:hypothetical protein